MKGEEVSKSSYSRPPGGLPPQTELSTDRAVCTDFYAVIPRRNMSDIVTSRLPGWHGTRLWVLARPMTGFAETFSHYVMEVEPGGGSSDPEPDMNAESVLFVTHGNALLKARDMDREVSAGGYVFLAPGDEWSLSVTGSEDCVFHWIRKSYQKADDTGYPTSFVLHEREVEPVAMPETDGRWTTKMFVEPEDLRHDMHVNIVSLHPGAVIPFAETHVMEHGLYVLEGKAVYRLNTDWVEVEAGDYMWLRAFCPQACYAGGPGLFRYLLYKDVNRHATLFSNDDSS